MNVIILNTNSFGGNYEYSRCLAEAYAANKEVHSCAVLIPSNALQPANDIFKKELISDIPRIKNKLYRKFYFLYRSFINPLKTFFFLRKQPASIVVFNDYEQITSLLWVPLFRSLKKKHEFLVILHDPDRDHYLPVKTLSVLTMKKVMSIMDLALYHEVLPDKIYYRLPIPKINVPHGIYDFKEQDYSFLEKLKKEKGTDRLLGMLGNIRDEKNYKLVIESLPDLPGTKLLIAGEQASSDVPVKEYKERIEELNLQDRIIWMQKRLTDEELQAAISICDVILLYYKKSFASQSGILNLIALHKKTVIVSDTPSALTETVRKFGLGKIIPEESSEFVSAIHTVFNTNMLNLDQQWSVYISYASWENHVQTVINNLQVNKSK